MSPTESSNTTPSNTPTSPSSRRQTRRLRSRRERIGSMRGAFFLGGLALLPLAAAVLFTLLSTIFAGPAHSAHRQRYEYRCMKRSQNITDHLNILGERGWKLVTAAGASETWAGHPPPAPGAPFEGDPPLTTFADDIRRAATNLAEEFTRENPSAADAPFVQRFSNAMAERAADALAERLLSSAPAQAPLQPVMVWCLMREVR